jgi:phosphoribosyl-ATP pyrophosphohydrolase
MAELLAKLRDDDDDIEAAIEAADVFIVLMRMFDRMGVEFSEVIDAKMELNRRRRWVSTNTGHGYHVRDGSEGG